MRKAAIAAIGLLACHRPAGPELGPSPATVASTADTDPRTTTGGPPADSPVVAACPMADGYRGTVAGVPVFARLAVDGARLHGRYFYEKAGIDIPLDGTITSGNALRVIEGNPRKSTGTFAGSCDSSTGVLAGTWTGASSRGEFRLDPIGPLDTPLVAKKRFTVRKPFLGPTSSGMTSCSDSEEWPEVFGLRDAAIERAVNAQGLEPRLGPIFDKSAAAEVESCDGAFELSFARTITVQPRELALVESSGWSNTDGAAHPENAIDFERSTVDLRTGKEIVAGDVFMKDVTRLVVACFETLHADEDLAGTWGQYANGGQFDLEKDGVHFWAQGLPHAFSPYTGQGPTLSYGVLLAKGLLRADSPVRRAWQDAPRAKRDALLCEKGVTPFG